MSEIDLVHYEGREQAYIKHCLLNKYLSSWGFKIGSKWDPLVFIDGFAGPWGSLDKDFADASFGIAINALANAIFGLEKIGRSINAACIFVEKAPQPFSKLEAFAKKHSSSRVQAIALRGRFSENIGTIEDYLKTLGPNAFKFVFLDQKGWAATPIEELRPFVQTRSCELLFTVMTSFLSRFVDRDGLAMSYQALFGKEDVLNRIRALPKGKGLREEFIVDEYCRSLRDLCGFKHVSQAVVLEPLKERIRYYLVFATNSLHGIEVF
jgi:three-Cys-motif partner protein